MKKRERIVDDRTRERKRVCVRERKKAKEREKSTRVEKLEKLSAKL